MTFFSAPTIAGWVTDFRALGNPVPERWRTLELDVQDTASDAGLVTLELDVATTGTFLRRPSRFRPQWEVHFEEREAEVVATATEVERLAAELAMIASLAAYLEARTAEALARHGAGRDT